MLSQLYSSEDIDNGCGGGSGGGGGVGGDGGGGDDGGGDDGGGVGCNGGDGEVVVMVAALVAATAMEIITL